MEEGRLTQRKLGFLFPKETKMGKLRYGAALFCTGATVAFLIWFFYSLVAVDGFAAAIATLFAIAFVIIAVAVTLFGIFSFWVVIFRKD